MVLKMTTTYTNDKEALLKLFSNIDLILEKKDKILSTPELYNFHILGMRIASMYIGGAELTIGNLLTLWETNEIWKTDNKYYYAIGGSPLSGMSFAYYYSCKKKKLGVDKNIKTFGTFARPAYKIAKNEKNKDLKIDEFLELLKK